MEDIKPNIKEMKSFQIQPASCVVSMTPLSADDPICKECPVKGSCTTINPELAAILERCLKPDGMYHFNKEDSDLLREKYPELFDLDFKGDYSDGETEYLIFYSE